MRFATLLALTGIVALAEPALALDKVRFGTNWLADPAAGGFFQAAADGTYEKYGLDVTIVPGGPVRWIGRRAVRARRSIAVRTHLVCATPVGVAEGQDGRSIAGEAAGPGPPAIARP